MTPTIDPAGFTDEDQETAVFLLIDLAEVEDTLDATLLVAKALAKEREKERARWVRRRSRGGMD